MAPTPHFSFSLFPSQYREGEWLMYGNILWNDASGETTKFEQASAYVSGMDMADWGETSVTNLRLVARLLAALFDMGVPMERVTDQQEVVHVTPALRPVSNARI